MSVSHRQSALHHFVLRPRPLCGLQSEPRPRPSIHTHTHTHTTTSKKNEQRKRKRSPHPSSASRATKSAAGHFLFYTTKPTRARYKLHKCGIDNPHGGCVCCVSLKQKRDGVLWGVCAMCIGTLVTVIVNTMQVEVMYEKCVKRTKHLAAVAQN